jgi:hypothetical protein
MNHKFNLSLNEEELMGLRDYPDYDDDSFLTDRYPSQYEEQLEKQLRDAGDYFSALLEQIYGDKPVDDLKVDSMVEEVCHCLGVKLPLGSPSVQRKRAQSPLFDFAVELTTNHAKAI